MKNIKDLQKWLDDNHAFADSSRKKLSSGITRLLKKNSEIIKEFQSILNIKSDNPAELIYNAINPGISHVCEICGKETPFDKFYNGYRKTCSQKCSHSLTERKGKITKQEKYGDSNFNNITKNRETKLKKYGDAFYTNLEKGHQTKLERYGDVNYNNSSKNKQTCLKRYGKENPAQVLEFKEKQQRTLFEKYGVNTPMESEKVKQLYINNYLKNHGAFWPLQDREVRKKFNFKKETSNERMIEEFLKNRGFHYIYQYECNGKNFDFAIFDENDNLNLLIETDGPYFHGLLSDVDGKNVRGETDCERFIKTPDNVKLLIADSDCEREILFSKILEVFNLDYNSWIDEIVDSLPEEFPYPQYDEKRLKTDWKHLCEYDYNKYQRLALSLIRQFHKSIYWAHVSTRSSPYEAWQDKTLLRKCVENRFIYSSNLSSQAIADGFNVCKIAPKVSVFNPSLSRHLIQKYLNEFDEIFDPFSGFSGRMLGACSLNKDYIGQDINTDHVREANEIIDFLKIHAQVKVQDILTSFGNYECLFTCPPYGGKEHWNVLNDAIEKSCDEWIDECLSRFNCKTYLFVVDKTSKYENNIAEVITNKSHLTTKEEYVVLIKK